MDSIDLKIIDLLMKDAQTPFSNIAEQLGVGTDTVIRRYRKLKEEGIIHHASVIIDLEKCGYRCHAFFTISVMPGADSSSLYDELTKVPNVLTVVNTIGDYDLMLHCIYSGEHQDLISLNKEIAKLEGIKYITIVSLPVKDFIPNFPSIGYYSKATPNSTAKETP